MRDSSKKQQAFAVFEQMKDLRGYPYGAKAVERAIAALLKASDGDVDRLAQAVAHFRGQEDPHVPTASEVRQYLYVEMQQLQASERLRVLKGQSRCEKCGNDGRYVKEGWIKNPLKPAIPPNVERKRPGRPQGRRWGSWVEFCECAIGQIRKNLWISLKQKQERAV
jgi:hypothetical protein